MSEKLSDYAASLAPLSLPVLAGDAVIVSRAGVDYQTPPGAAYSIAMSVALTRGGVEFANFSNPAENVLQYQGEGDSQTTAIHLNPGTGTLPTGTIAEVVVERTNTQAFGGNYGRWSFTCLGSANGNQSGIFGEYGGTTPIGSYICQVGIENPPGVFTSFEGWRFNPGPGVAEDDNQGSVAFGVTATVSRNQITMPIANIGVPGTRDSHAILWEGKANNGTERAAWWRALVNVTSQAGASIFTVQSNLNGAGWVTRLQISDAGALTALGGVAAASNLLAFPRTIHTGGVGGTLATNAFSAQTPVATEVYTAEIFIPCNMTITGVALLNSGTISGNVKVGLCDRSGIVLATSASTAQAGTNVFQRIPFTGTYAALGPASYYVVVFFDNNTTRPWAHTVGNFGTGVLTGQVYATGFVSNALLAPSTFTTALGPVATLY